MKIPIYRWNGQYFGFIYNKRLFDKFSRYLGWIDENEVWDKEGTYLGEIIDENYILRSTKISNRLIRAIKPTPAIPTSPVKRTPRAAREIKGFYVDSLNVFSECCVNNKKSFPVYIKINE